MIKVVSLKMTCIMFVFSAAVSTVAYAQTFKSLASFDGTDGYQPYAGLVQGTDGNFYGTTLGGGNTNCSLGCGTVFRIAPAGKLTILYGFCSQLGCPDGYYPWGGLVLATDGNFYGTTYAGGPGGLGNIFRITATGKLTNVSGFCNGGQCGGEGPFSGLVLARDGAFYGTTYFGGANNAGTVFRITPSGDLTTLYSFCTQANCTDGTHPWAGLVQGTDGNFYGTTLYGGANINQLCDSNGSGCGTVFKISSSGKLTTLYSFCAQSSCADGANPWAGLVQANDGNLYGTTTYGGGLNCSNDCGTAFRITPAGQLTTIHSFCTSTCADGFHPYAGLIQGTDGNLYGTTSIGGVNFGGVIFKLTTSGTVTPLYSLCQTTGCGYFPWAPLLQGTDGNFYGTASEGGINNSGTVFSLSTGLAPFVGFVRDFGKVGSKVEILGQRFKGTTQVSFNGTAAKFAIHSNTYLTATIPSGATSGFVTVTTPKRKLKSNKIFRVVR